MTRWGLQRRVHVSWLIAWLCVGVVIGVALVGGMKTDSFSSIAWPLTAGLLVAVGLIRAYRWMVGMMVVAGILFGVWRGTLTRGSELLVSRSVGSTVRLMGTVKEDADTDNRGQTVLRLGDIAINTVATGGTVWVTTNTHAEVHRSDRVTVEGKLVDGFGNFSASMYSVQLKSVQRPEPGDIALKVRDVFAAGVERAVDEPKSSLGLGYLVGQRRGLPVELDAALVAAGLTHIVVASGYNLTILVRLARRLFEKISKYLSFLSASVMIVGFVAITGLSPSMSRAGLVAGLSLLAWYYGRRFHPLVLLPFAMALTVLWQPSYAWGDLGWQLSFAAFAGVMIGAPLVQAYFFGDKPERSLRRIFVETISAQVWTLPILLLAFGTVSVVAPIANILILPLVPLAMLLTLIAGLAGLFLPNGAEIVGLPADWLLTYMTSLTTYFGNLPWAMQEISIGPVSFGLLYVAIIGITIYMWRKTRLGLEQTSLVE